MNYLVGIPKDRFCHIGLKNCMPSNMFKVDIVFLDPCSRNPCVHGTCSPSGTTYSCACTPGYTGPTCASGKSLSLNGLLR